MKAHRYSPQSGFSLIELLIVIVIVGIVVTFAVAQFGNSANSLERQNVTREFKSSLERARFDSVKRRASVCADMSRVEITSATSFNLITDSNQNGTIELAAETKTINFASSSDVEIVPNSLVFPIIFRFDQRGNVASGTCASPTAVVPNTTFCNLPCTTAGAQNSNVVFISPTGTAALLRGGETVPLFGNPTVSSVSSDVQVNPLLAVWDAIAGTPTPSPSPGPSVLPTATPTASPTASPLPSPSPTVSPSPGPSATPTPVATPTPSPTPSPTPRACTIGQKPASDNCECRDPLIFHDASGKCRSR